MSSTIDLEQEKYDEVLMQIAGQIGSVQGLLDKFFGFMHRKTDFYVEYQAPNEKATMGFPVGAAEKMVLKCFKKYNMKDYAPQIGTVKYHSADDVKSRSSPSLKGEEEHPSTTIATSSSISASSNSKVVVLNPKGQQIPIGNGGVADNYYWTQTLNEVTMHVDAVGASKGKDINCVIKPKSFRLAANGQVLIEGEFEEAVRVDESMWSLNIGTQNGDKKESSEVVVTLEKTRKTWWKHVMIGHPEIDTSKVDSTQRIDEYDEGTQAALRKVMFDQRQKSLGLSTSEEIETENILKLARNAPNSPLL